MKLNWKAYGVLGGIFVLSIGTLFATDGSELVEAIIAAPGATALLGALFQLMRDEADYEKQMESQRREFQFTIGAASHMANAAFDKHVEFCEKYMRELHDAVTTLYREGEPPPPRWIMQISFTESARIIRFGSQNRSILI